MKSWLFAFGAVGLVAALGAAAGLPDKWSDLFFSETAQLNGS